MLYLSASGSIDGKGETQILLSFLTFSVVSVILCDKTFFVSLGANQFSAGKRDGGDEGGLRLHLQSGSFRQFSLPAIKREKCHGR
jgi:hypothetical protein